MSNRNYVVRGWRPFNRFHRPLESLDLLAPGEHFSSISGPDEAFIYERLTDRTLVKVADPSLVTVNRYQWVVR